MEKRKGKTKEGEDRWEPILFHTDLKSALVSLTELQIRLIDSSVPEEIIASIARIKDEVISSMDTFRQLGV